ATTVPSALTRPGLIVVAPSSAPTNAGNKYSGPTLLWPTCNLEARTTPVNAVVRPETTNAPMTKRLVRTPTSSAAGRFEPPAYRYRPIGKNSRAAQKISATTTTYHAGSGMPSTDV